MQGKKQDSVTLQNKLDYNSTQRKQRKWDFKHLNSNKAILLDGNEIHVDKFVYLGIVISTEDSTQKDNTQTFKSKNFISDKVQNIWRSKQYSETIQQQCKINLTLR
jgi:hypothetical protein